MMMGNNHVEIFLLNVRFFISLFCIRIAES